MPRPRPPSNAELQHKVHDLQMRLLKVNSELRLKALAVERLETLVCQRNKRIDSLFALLEQARQQNIKLEMEAEHLAAIIANDSRSQAQINGGLEAP